jgi:hypothetical protein
VRKTPFTSCHRNLELCQALQSVTPGIEEQFLLPGFHQAVLGPKRLMTGGGQPVPSKVTLIPCPALRPRQTAAINSAARMLREKMVKITFLHG